MIGGLTGTLAPRRLVEETCEIAQAHGLLIVADEIYRDLAHDPDTFRGPADLVPERSFVTNGLSKAMALGAKCVLTGRATLYGTAVGGEAGAAKAIGIIQTEMDKTMAYTGCCGVD